MDAPPGHYRRSPGEYNTTPAGEACAHTQPVSRLQRTTGGLLTLRGAITRQHCGDCAAYVGDRTSGD